MAASTSDRRVRLGGSTRRTGRRLRGYVLVVGGALLLGHHLGVRVPEVRARGEGVDRELQTEVAADERVRLAGPGPAGLVVDDGQPMWPGVDAVDRAVRARPRPSGRATANGRSVPNGSSVAAGRTPCFPRAARSSSTKPSEPTPEPALLELPVQGQADLALRLGGHASSGGSATSRRGPAPTGLVRLRQVARANQLADHGLQHGVHQNAAISQAEGSSSCSASTSRRRARAGRSS